MTGGKEREVRLMLGEDEREKIIREWLDSVYLKEEDKEEMYTEVNRLLVSLNVYDYDAYYNRIIKEVE